MGTRMTQFWRRASYAWKMVLFRLETNLVYFTISKLCCCLQSFKNGINFRILALFFEFFHKMPRFSLQKWPVIEESTINIKYIWKKVTLFLSVFGILCLPKNLPLEDISFSLQYSRYVSHFQSKWNLKKNFDN